MSEPPVAPESPQSLLAQMEQMLAALSADLVQLDAEMQPPVGHTAEQQGDASFISGADRA